MQLRIFLNLSKEYIDSIKTEESAIKATKAAGNLRAVLLIVVYFDYVQRERMQQRFVSSFINEDLGGETRSKN